MILCSGCFDGLHIGHVRYLQTAAALYPHQSLKVAVAPDATIRRKGREPVWPQADRAVVVGAIKLVRGVILQTEESVATVIRTTKPDAFVKGSDWRGRLPEDVVAACLDVGAAMVFTALPHAREAR